MLCFVTGNQLGKALEYIWACKQTSDLRQHGVESGLSVAIQLRGDMSVPGFS